jgi:hypothetical protein
MFVLCSIKDGYLQITTTVSFRLVDAGKMARDSKITIQITVINLPISQNGARIQENTENFLAIVYRKQGET